MPEPRMAGVDRGREVTFEIDGEPVAARQGETVAMALFAAGRLSVRRSSKLGAPRGVFCNMGICYECLVYLDAPTGRRFAVRSCMLLVADGMKLESWAPEGDGEPRAT